MKKNIFSFIKIALAFCSCFATIGFVYNTFIENKAEAISQVGSTGPEVEAIQELLTQYGIYNSGITGYYGEATRDAVKRFQRINGISETGIAGPQTLARMGISVGQIPEATEANISILARIISAEGRGETYSGQVAIGACVLNRIEHPSFPDTLWGVIYEDGAFTAVTDGQINEPVADSAYRAARDAFNGVDPTGGAIYYYNPNKTNDQWIRTRQVVCIIGSHLFCI